GAVRYYLGIHRDVTELHELNERLQNQKRLIESIIDLAPVAVALLDENERVLLDNHEYKKLMGSFGMQEPAHAILSGLRTELSESAWAQILARDEFVDQMLRFDRAGGQGPRWFAASGAWFMQSEPSAETFFTSASKRYLLLVLTDVTALKRQQQEQWLQALRTMLAEGELVARLRETLAGAAYQLAGPLNLMAAAEKRVAQRIPAGDAALVALHEARQQGEEALALLQGAMPSIPAEAWMPLNCNELLHDVLDLSTDRLLAEGVVVDWKPALRLPSVSGQAVALRGAFHQLIANALDALHDSRRPLRVLKLGTRQEGDWIELDIVDSGPGIPEALRLKVFEPFFTTRPKGARAGMGLALAQEIVLRHGGCLEIDPAYLLGCRVIVRLPTVQEEIGHG
ncbi:MAG: nitrogen fixation negative regulator NifL, partial [Formivibrio sp.]|nr:nitrogen fixation negative regulator NifL [Formivibrio sp.]